MPAIGWAQSLVLTQALAWSTCHESGNFASSCMVTFWRCTFCAGNCFALLCVCTCLWRVTQFPQQLLVLFFSSFFFKLQSEIYSGSEEKLCGSGTSFIHAMSTVLLHKTLPKAGSLGRLKRLPNAPSDKRNPSKSGVPLYLLLLRITDMSNRLRSKF